jgi:hypothetical protein
VRATPDLIIPVRALLAWSRTSQETSRRNAMLASTALLERRREHDEVRAFIDDVLARREAG